MTSLRTPRLGPIVGHTTHNSCRLWIAAGDPSDNGAILASDRRTIGILGIITKSAKGKPSVERAYYFRLHREYDRTGTFMLGQDVSLGRHTTDGLSAAKADEATPLLSSTSYTVRMATLTLDDPLPDAESLSDAALTGRLPDINNIQDELLKLSAKESEATFTTYPQDDDIQDSIGFLLGSCRYPGIFWKAKKSDRIFGPMSQRFLGFDERGRKKDPAAQFVLMAGDQIYADLMNRFPVGRADTYQEFQDRYSDALGSPNMRKMLRQTPVYMILDDHEIEDNWTQDRLKQDGRHKIFNYAIGAYMSYQWSHSPRTYGELLYYNFNCGGYPFFVLDARTQRFKDDREGLADNHLLGRPSIDPDHPGQLQRLLDWLAAQQKNHGNIPKFIASSSVFAPNQMDERTNTDKINYDKPDPINSIKYKANESGRGKSDSWPAYPETRSEILDHILKHRIQNVIFLTGDIHCSNIARMFLQKDSEDVGLRLYDVTSSAFYWPFPFADGDPNSYVHDSTKSKQKDVFPVSKDHEMHYKSWGFTQKDNFCRIDVDRKGECLRVRYFDRNGKGIKISSETSRRKTVENTLYSESLEFRQRC